MLRKVVSNIVYNEKRWRGSGYYIVSLSCRTIIYKGMFLADQLGKYYPDLHEPDFETALALVHQRFSTNTFPSWPLAHPYRMVAHNGEINTLRGNVNWMAARQASVSSQALTATTSPSSGRSPMRASPTPPASTTRSNSWCRAATRCAHAAMMLIPEAWAGNPLMDDERKRLLRISRRADGAVGRPRRASPSPTAARSAPRSTATACGRRATSSPTDDRVIMASEAGVLPMPEDEIVQKWRLQPGKMLLIDLEEGRIISDEEIKARASPASTPMRSG